MSSSNIIYKLKTSQITLLDILHTRKYLNIKKKDFINNLSELKKKFLNNELIYNFNNEDNTKSITIIYLCNFTQKEIDTIIKEKYNNENQKNDELILILLKPKYVNVYNKYMYTYKGYVTIFNIQSLLFNITKNIYVPKHEIMLKKEKNILLKTKKKEYIPRIILIDPVIKFIGGKINDIIKITRINSYTSDINYRLVI